MNARWGALFCAVLAAAILAGGQAWCDARPTLTFSSVEGSFNSRIVETVLRRAYDSLGYDIHVRYMSAARALVESSIGEVDGELQRIKSVGKKYPSLKRVEPAIFPLRVTPFVVEGAAPVMDMDDLRMRKVGYQLGIKYAEDLVRTNRLDAVAAVDGARLFRKLAQGRVDVVVTNRLNGRQFLRMAGIDNVVEAGPPLASFDLYHYLHERHVDLVPAVGRALADMHASGEIERIIRSVVDGADPD